MKITRLKPFSPTWRSLTHHKGHVIANREELEVIFGKHSYKDKSERYDGVQYAWGFKIVLNNKLCPIVLHDFQTFFKLDKKAYISWRINAASKVDSEQLRKLLDKALYILRKVKRDDTKGSAN